MSRSLVISLIVGITALVPAGPALAAKSHPAVGTARAITHDSNFEDWANAVRSHRGRVVVGEDGNGILPRR